MSSEWFWAALICGIPFLIFGVMEIAGLLRRRRFDALARRSKALPERAGRVARRAD